MSGIWEQQQQGSSVYIATPLGGASLVPSQWATYLVGLVAKTTQAGVNINIGAMKHYCVDLCRNTLAREFLKSQCTHIFWLDSDVLMPDDTILRLLSYNLPVVGGVIFDKKRRLADGNNPTGPAAWIKTDTPGKYVTLSLDNPPGLYEVDWSCMGAILCKREVFEKMEPPWFVYEHEREWKDREAQVGGSEDRYFFYKARAAGFPGVLDLSLRGVHIGQAAVGPDNNILDWY